VANSLETFDNGSGQVLVRDKNSSTTLTLTGGQLQGTLDVRDGALANLQTSLNTLASTLITQVNNIHSQGFALDGSTGANFFSGTNASDIKVNPALANNPSALQASGTSGATGDNKTALALAQLADQKLTGLNNQTFSQSYGVAVSTLGDALHSVNGRIDDQQAVDSMLQSQRQSVSGVSLDEEMTDVMKYQKAYEASAKLINTIDEMLDTVLSLKR
jgi:flagellar hook-associated protein 1 FlgK